MKKIGLYAGSFDPYTNGHHAILKKAAALMDEVHVLIGVNSQKKRFFDPEKMRAAIEDSARADGMENVKAVVFEGMVADYCADNGIKYYVRGLRNNTDYDYEENIARINHLINPELETIYMRAEEAAISSTMIRELLKYGKNVSSYVPEAVLDVIE